jgi:hypothetical protein
LKILDGAAIVLGILLFFVFIMLAYICKELIHGVETVRNLSLIKLGIINLKFYLIAGCFKSEEI